MSAPPRPPEAPEATGPRAPGFVAFFIDRPIFAAVVAILITLIGAISLPQLQVSQFPPIAPPTVFVSASYTGASADVVERTITLPIEEQVNGTEGMLYMSSTSANDGQMSMTVTFELGRDPDLAAVNVNNRVAVALPRLPEEVRRLGVTVRKQSPELTLVANLLSPDGSRDSLFLSNFALINVLDSLKRVPGVGDVNIFGERRYAMRIWLDPERLAKLGLTASDVIDAVREQNVQIAAGRAGSPPAPDGVQLEIPLRTAGPPLHGRGVRADRDPRRAGRLAAAPRRRRARRARRAELRRVRAPHRPARRHARRVPAPGGQRARSVARRARGAETAVGELPVRRRADGPLRPDPVRGRVDLRGACARCSRRSRSCSSSSTCSSRTGAPR